MSFSKLLKACLPRSDESLEKGESRAFGSSYGGVTANYSGSYLARRALRKARGGA